MMGFRLYLKEQNKWNVRRIASKRCAQCIGIINNRKQTKSVLQL